MTHRAEAILRTLLCIFCQQSQQWITKLGAGVIEVSVKL